MKNFEKFKKETVNLWKNYQKKNGMNFPSRRKIGDQGENYAKYKINKIDKPKYQAYKTEGSRTPADIFAFAKRKGYYHIMLIQIKTSIKKDNIYELNENEIKEFAEFGKFVKKRFLQSKYTKKYIKQNLLFSIGYFGIHRNDKKRTYHKLIKKRFFKHFTKGLNKERINEDMKSLLEKI